MKNELYPLIFEPVLKEKVWGGHKLYERFHKGDDASLPDRQAGAKVGESWEIADLQEGQSIVKEGALSGRTLHEVIEMNPDGLLGKRVHKRFGTDFPLLIKFIDATKDLSIQVHPSDENSPTGTGKTEMWYIMQADPGAELTVGFVPGMTREKFEKHIKDDTVEEAMNTHEVNAGDSYFIHSGRIHAIGGGIVLAEIQQTSDVTYRVYDYNRPDDNGNMRELHIKESLDVLEYKDTQDFRLDYDRKPNAVQTLKHHKYFKTDWLEIKGAPHKITRDDSFTIIIVVAGKISYTYDGENHELLAGTSFLIPAACKEVVLNASEAEILEVYL